MLIALLLSVAFNIVLAWLFYQALNDNADLNTKLRHIEYELGRRDAYVHPSRIDLSKKPRHA